MSRNLELFDWQQRREVEYFGLVREIETGVGGQAPAPGKKGTAASSGPTWAKWM